ncbi:MAG: hypothetical protein L0I94_11470 [Yaniella sp.]|nr:hypothetical protein [Yaniella sp.]MDN6534271.1 hypothetical protein [Yaniella sp.]
MNAEGPQAGWYPLILDLDAKIGSIEPDYRVDQIKEKFGAYGSTTTR